MTGRKRYDTEFGASVSTALAVAKTTQNQLATDIGQRNPYPPGAGVQADQPCLAVKAGHQVREVEERHACVYGPVWS